MSDIKKWIKQEKPVVVEWVDSMSSAGWHIFEKADMTCYTVGMLYKSMKDRIVIAGNKSAHGYGEYMEIPKIAIKKITRFKV